MLEFTGERVVPGQVDVDLWGEHVARYAFAARYAHGKHVLDAGCGAGYGSAQLAEAGASVLGVDFSAEAIQFAARNYSGPRARFLQASCTAVPFQDGYFDLVVAFEVIEHLDEYRSFLTECARILAPGGLFIVSSPNKTYYAESRKQAGPNPFHHHEFEPEEFVRELGCVFPTVKLLVQNRVEAFAFYADNTGGGAADARIQYHSNDPAYDHFLIAICAKEMPSEPNAFVYVPQAANVLRERELHIELLTKQIAEARSERDSMILVSKRQQRELKERTEWAERLDVELKAASNRVLELQNELEAMRRGYEAKVEELEGYNVAKTQWALRLDSELRQSEALVVERTEWAQREEAERTRLSEILDLVRASRWIKLGNKLGLGPVIQKP